jgi:hypothetical protein
MSTRIDEFLVRFGLFARFCGTFQVLLRDLPAFRLEAAKFFVVAVALAAEASFLQLEVAEFTFVGLVNIKFDQVDPQGRRLVLMSVCQEGAAFGVDGHLEAGDPFDRQAISAKDCVRRVSR